jgi:hypothetical protein
MASRRASKSIGPLSSLLNEFKLATVSLAICRRRKLLEDLESESERRNRCEYPRVRMSLHRPPKLVPRLYRFSRSSYFLHRSSLPTTKGTVVVSSIGLCIVASAISYHRAIPNHTHHNLHEEPDQVLDDDHENLKNLQKISLARGAE